MNSKKKLALNTFLPLFNKIVTLLCGLVLPRVFIGRYGSDVNGLIASISNFIGMIALLDMGMGAVVESSLYKPLADNNEIEVSRVVKSCKKFFEKIAAFFLIYLCVLSVIYPILIRNDFGWLFEASLIIILAIDSFANYYFGISYSLLLKADQKTYIPMAINTICTVLNFICCFALIHIGVVVHVVKLTSAVVFLLKPIYLNYYVSKHYNLVKDVDISTEPIKQKWNGVAQHFAYYVTDHTDVMVLSFMSTLSNVSIYTVYNMVVSGIRDIIVISQSGIQALIGRLYARNEHEKLIRIFNLYEWVIHTVSTILFTCTGILIIPFIKVYTSNITDANYVQPLFAIILIVAVYMYCLRFPYHIMVLVAGHYKQTQASSIIEMILNISTTVIFVHYLGLVGVAVGTLISLTYRTIYLVHYNHKLLDEYEPSSFYLAMLCNIVVITLSYFASLLINVDVVNYVGWILYAIIVFLLVSVISLIINGLFNREKVKDVFWRVALKGR